MNSESVVISAYNGTATDVSIPAEINGKKIRGVKSSAISPDVVGLSKEQYTLREKIWRISIPTELEFVEPDIFNHPALKEINIPNHLISLQTMAWYASDTEFHYAKKFNFICGSTESTTLKSDDFNIGNVIKFGNYWEESEENSEGQLTKKDFQWEVIAVDDGKALLLSESIPCSVEYSFEGGGWKKSIIRKWLNKSLIDYAFSNDEKTRILLKDIENSEGGNTRDRLFLLSVDEVEKYIPDKADRIRLLENCFLRTTRNSQKDVVMIDGDGNYQEVSNSIGLGLFMDFKVALWIKLY